LQLQAEVVVQVTQVGQVVQAEVAQVNLQLQTQDKVSQEHNQQVEQVEQVAVEPQEHNYLVEQQQDQTDQVEVVVGMAAAQVVMMEVVVEVVPAM
jgi:hypothetical protein